jgi:outer membrane protein TolC
VAGAYLQAIAAQGRVQAERAQVETANTLYQQAVQQRGAGVLALTDLNRSEVQLLTERQRLVSLENEFAKEKINLARLTGLPPRETYELSDDMAFSPAPELSLEDARKEASLRRADLRAAEMQLRAARFTLSAARAERLPSLSLSADYGAIGTNPAQSHGTFAVVGTLSLPIWQGGRAEGDIEQANAALGQRQAELEDTRSRVESEVRSAFLDLQSAAQQVEVARRSVEVAKQNLDLIRQRFEAGVSDNLEVVQAQQSVAAAQLDYINSVFAHNVAKLSLGRAVGAVSENFVRFVSVK